MAVQSVPGLNGTSRQPLGSFAGKTESIPVKPVQLFSVPALNGTSRAPLASFAGKSAALIDDNPSRKRRHFIKNMGRGMG